MSLEVITGNILDIEDGLICHFCNVEGVMGAGLAKQIKEKYPRVFTEYKRANRTLGSYIIARAGLTLWVCNLVTQDLKGKGTNYYAVLRAFESLELELRGSWTQLYFPEMVGCGLGKGNPDAIHAMIEYFFPRAILVRYNS